MALQNAAWFIYLALIILVIPATIVIIYAIYIVIQRRKYSHIPTPTITRFFSGHTSEIEKLRHQGPSIDQFALKWIKELKTDILCIWFYHAPIFVVTGVENVRDVMVNKYDRLKELNEQIANPFGERYMGNGMIAIPEYDLWKPRRQLFNPAFHRICVGTFGTASKKSMDTVEHINKQLKDLVPVFNHTTDLLVNKLRKVADGKTEVKMYNEFSKCTLNIIANAGCGLDVDLVNNKLELGEYVPRVMEGIEYLIFHPMYWLNPMTWKYVEEIKEAIRKLRKIGRDVILKRRQELVEGKELEKDLLSFIVKAADKDTSLSVEDLVDEYSTFFLAGTQKCFDTRTESLETRGHETTGSLLGISLLLIGKHPEVEQKLLDEIEEVVGNKKSVDFEDLPKLNYMGQVSLEVGTSLQKTPCHNLVHNQTLLNEVFPETPTILSTLQEYRDRGAVSYQTHFQHCLATALAQAVSFSILTGCDLNDELFENFSKLKFDLKVIESLGTFLQKYQQYIEILCGLPGTLKVFKEVLRLWPIASVTARILPKGHVISGYKFPEKADVFVSFYVNGRHPDYWTDPDTFDPDRFGEGHRYEPMMHTPFSAGARNCIGQHMAQMEAKVLLACFLQEFKFKLSPEQDMGIHESGTLKPKAGTRGTLLIRKKDN